MQNLTPALAEIEWHDGQPYASAFQDVYFSSDNGMLETEYVFLQGNDLYHRWPQLDTDSFTIAETGFGTGLNFLCASKLWLSTASENAVLHFISTEKYPLSMQDITTALRLWPELHTISEPLITQYEQLINGIEIMLYDHRVRLSLLIGDATECLSNINPNKVGNEINAWFLDGFSPAKNPEMWQSGLFKQMARLSNHATTFATFTSAGDVRRDLSVAGFEISKQPGFGKKREMLTGRFAGNQSAA